MNKPLQLQTVVGDLFSMNNNVRVSRDLHVPSIATKCVRAGRDLHVPMFN